MNESEDIGDSPSPVDRIRSILVAAATVGTIAFNGLAAAGRVNGVTPAEVSDSYPTVITPAGYAFSIWSLIYLGLIAFSVFQLLPRNYRRFREIRSPYILSCALNCAWIFFWHSGQIAICLAIIAGLFVVLVYINARLKVSHSVAETLTVKGPFGIYMGWVAAATLVNLAVLLVAMNVEAGRSSALMGAALLLTAAAIGVAARALLLNYAAPLAVAWALTAVAVKQSGNTLVVSAAAVGVIACLIAAASVVLTLKSTNHE